MSPYFNLTLGYTTTSLLLQLLLQLLLLSSKCCKRLSLSSVGSSSSFSSNVTTVGIRRTIRTIHAYSVSQVSRTLSSSSSYSSIHFHVEDNGYIFLFLLDNDRGISDDFSTVETDNVEKMTMKKHSLNCSLGIARSLTSISHHVPVRSDLKNRFVQQHQKENNTTVYLFLFVFVAWRIGV